VPQWLHNQRILQKLALFDELIRFLELIGSDVFHFERVMSRTITAREFRPFGIFMDFSC
jgi:hypothetical protein